MGCEGWIDIYDAKAIQEHFDYGILELLATHVLHAYVHTINIDGKEVQVFHVYNHSNRDSKDMYHQNWQYPDESDYWMNDEVKAMLVPVIKWIKAQKEFHLGHWEVWT